MRPGHVCFLGYELHDPWVEGTRVLTRDFMRALDTAGVGVSAASTRTGPDDSLAGFDVSYVNPSVISSVARRIDVPGNNVDALLFLRLAAALRRQVSRHEADLIHAGFASHSIFSIVSKIPPSTPFVAHLFGKVEHQQWLKRLGTIERVDAYVTSSDLDVSTLQALGVDEAKIHRVPPPIYPPDGDRKAGRRLLDVSHDSFVVGYLGNVDEERFPTSFLKRLDEFAAEDETEAVIVTKDVGTREIEFGSSENVSVVERALTERQKADVFAGPDVWVFPFDFERPDAAPVIDPPLSVLEALAAGRPVVTTRSLSLSTYVPHQDGGVLHEPGDITGIIDTLRAFRNGDYDIDTFGSNAHRHAERVFNPDRSASELLSVYQSVLTEESG